MHFLGQYIHMVDFSFLFFDHRLISFTIILSYPHFFNFTTGAGDPRERGKRLSPLVSFFFLFSKTCLWEAMILLAGKRPCVEASKEGA